MSLEFESAQLETEHLERGVTFNYNKIEGFAKKYLETYFKGIDQDEIEIARFLVEEYKKLDGNTNFLDIGCGPTIHHILPLAPYASHIECADYLPFNIAEIQKWKENAPDSHNWNHFTEMILAMEGAQASNSNQIAARENDLKEKIKQLRYCNVLRKDPLGTPETYDAVGFFYCAEEVGIEKESWESIMENISSLVRPGGKLFLSALRNTDHYLLKSHDGKVESLPTAIISENHFYELLPKIGFDLDKTIIEIANTPEQEDLGFSSIILVSAQKKF